MPYHPAVTQRPVKTHALALIQSMIQVADYIVCIFSLIPLKPVFYSSRERLKKVLGWRVLSKPNTELTS